MITLMVFFLATAGLTYALIRYAHQKQWLDHPDHRSAHTVPTPRGGGLSIVLVFLTALILHGHYTLAAAGFLVALIGGWDDHRNLSPMLRLAVHGLAAIAVVYTLPADLSIHFVAWEIEFSLIGLGLLVVTLMWFINLTNFMDGIDGLAATQTLSVALINAAILQWVFLENELAWLYLSLGIITLGFLVWNWPPARVFMGDVASGFLGLVLGALWLYAAVLEPLMFWVGLIVFGVFVVDATLTLLRRAVTGQKVTQPHNCHAYQYAARHFKSHQKVTLAVLAINVIWLAPLAYLVATQHLPGVAGLLIAYAPLVILAFKFKGGVSRNG
ncbi:MAG: glycosyltransferase family 4 protein [Thiomicrorhabdus chilensis]|uniref:MraY family glycosyltransferase n=1 Tax=Thiomicrorhabdus chilensis TaxID=63656 RepID=UPI00299E28C4|nr:glycosyltransferase family 4 protein [Thiomicrorhabdus chilensis]MDX1347435.1 glycosyltransferase family 4 protein [Thiomicrorhabdus chilensis]